LKRSLTVLFPYAVFALLALISWNRWIQPYVDTGRELAVPWRVAHGGKLYREIHFHHGPLAPYAGAAIDRLAGRSLAARTVFAALVALLHLEALRRLAARVLAPGRAALATGLAVALAYFLRPGGWLFPFSFDTAIAVAALLWTLALAGRKTFAADLAAALCLTAALLSRPELGLAGMAAAGLESRERPRRLLLLLLLPLGVSALIYAGLSLGTPFATLVSDGWLALLKPPEAFRNVYRAYSGLDRPALRLAELALAGILLLLIGSLLAAAAALARAASRRPLLARVPEAIVLAVLAAAAIVAARPPAALAGTLGLVPPLPRIVPAVLVAAAIVRAVEIVRRKPPRGAFAAVPDAALALAALFAARLLLAAGYAGPYNAFFLPLPAVVACAGLWNAAEKWSAEIGEDLPRLVSEALFLLLVSRLLVFAGFYRGAGWATVETPAGSLALPEPVAQTTRLALQDLEGRLPAPGRLTGFPEAGFFNYVLGKENPLWLEQFFPGHLDEAGQTRAITELERDPPEALVLINVLAVGEGARAFGKDYSQRLGRAIDRDFRFAASYGPGARREERIGDPGFFIEIRVPAEGLSESTRRSR
jgi:hypothetical protein